MASFIASAGYWQADPHPGNLLLLNRKLDIGLIDFGQTKMLGNEKRVAFARLVDAMARRNPDDVAAGMAALGIVVEEVSQGKVASKRLATRSGHARRGTTAAAAETSTLASATPGATLSVSSSRPHSRRWRPAFWRPRMVAAVPEVTVGGGGSGKHKALASRTSLAPMLTSAEKLAYTMFDTAEYEGVSSNPFSDESALRSATVTELPKELFFLLRTMQIMRGICAATGNSDFSLAKSWAPLARSALQSSPRPQ
jgi:ABC1 atypical kinase-like domain